MAKKWPKMVVKWPILKVVSFFMHKSIPMSHSALYQAVTTVSPKLQFFKVEFASLNSTPNFFGPMVQWLALWTAVRQNESTNPCRGTLFLFIYVLHTLGCVTFFQTSRYQGILKATVSGVFGDLKFKISEGSDQN